MEGWGPGQEKEPPMAKQGNGTFVPFVSSGCLEMRGLLQVPLLFAL